MATVHLDVSLYQRKMRRDEERKPPSERKGLSDSAIEPMNMNKKRRPFNNEYSLSLSNQGTFLFCPWPTNTDRHADNKITLSSAFNSSLDLAS